jgi:hypothetical protein
MYGVNLKYLSLLLYFLICIPSPHVSLPFFGVIGILLLQNFSFVDDFVMITIENLFLLLSILGIILFINKRLILSLFGQLILIISIVIMTKIEYLNHFEFIIPLILHLFVSALFYVKLFKEKNEK